MLTVNSITLHRCSELTVTLNGSPENAVVVSISPTGRFFVLGPCNDHRQVVEVTPTGMQSVSQSELDQALNIATVDVVWQYYCVIFRANTSSGGKRLLRQTFHFANCGEERTRQFAQGRDVKAVFLEGTVMGSSVWAEVKLETFAIGTLEFLCPYHQDIV